MTVRSFLLARAGVFSSFGWGHAVALPRSDFRPIAFLAQWGRIGLRPKMMVRRLGRPE
jgi:hypothetical protein